MGKNLSRVSYGLISIGVLTGFWGVNTQGLVLGLPAKQTQVQVAPTPTKRTSRCPSDLQTLTDMLLKDIPSYANRVMQRARQIDKNISSTYVLVAGRPEFEPLPLTQGPSQYAPVFPNSTQQVFFTTLERQYSHNKPVQMQLYHWLFLTLTDQGWQLNTVFTRIGSSVAGQPPLPPRESRDGIIGQAVTLWLRDCEQGFIQDHRQQNPRNK
ncbi:hypothetical protein [Gloeothece verrucosa]|uniref:Uncharacterized protein n=1 Tax=Gloeothece verrucosa (strain PCC 7822) TaxID=497965 RepID=E0UGV5_GLOV7|nr:hypothetical protein [Gloeothece verrucosa]ADN14436.1 hypothetical protein Cyan7822_2463 [Gloeothece verrucosa PCC 7822]